MAQAILDQVIHQMYSFPPEELDRLEHAIRERRAESAVAPHQESYHQALLASGLVTRIAWRAEPDTSERRRVEVQGEPVSETILRERR